MVENFKHIQKMYQIELYETIILTILNFKTGLDSLFD